LTDEKKNQGGEDKPAGISLQGCKHGCQTGTGN